MENKTYVKYNNRKIYNLNKHKYINMDKILKDLYRHLTIDKSCIDSFFILKKTRGLKGKNETSKILTEIMAHELKHFKPLPLKVIENTMKYKGIYDALIELYNKDLEEMKWRRK